MWFPTDFDYNAAVAAGLIPDDETVETVEVYGMKVPVKRYSDSNWCKPCEIFTEEDTCFICGNTEMVEVTSKVRNRYPSHMHHGVLVNDLLTDEGISFAEFIVADRVPSDGVVLDGYPG